MANLFTVTVNIEDGNVYKTPKDIAFFSADTLVVENHDYAPNNAYIEYGGHKFYSESTVDEIVVAANLYTTDQFEANIVSIDNNPLKTPIQVGFPIKGSQVWPSTEVSGANCYVLFKGVKYYAVETVAALVAESNSGIAPAAPVTPANPTAAVGLAAVNGSSTQFMRADAAPPLDPTILTQTGEANKIPQLDNGGTLVLQNSTQRTEYAASSIFMYGPNASWLDIDASGMEIDLIGSGTTIHMGLDGIDAASQPITTTHIPTAENDLVNKLYMDSQIGAITTGEQQKGSWNAATNTPTLADGVGTNGDYYVVSVAGSRDLGSGTIAFGVGDHVRYTAGVVNKWERYQVSQPVSANPSATIGLTIKNGVADTYMRSDAAPALDQNIAPTWTAAHKFSNDVTVGGMLGSAANTAMPSPTNSGITLGGAPSWAMMSLYDQALTANNRTADLLFITNQIKFRFVNDARNAFLDVLSITGGQAMGVTGIASTSGTGAWVHTGAFTKTGLDTTVTGADGVKLWLAKYTSGTGHNNAPTAIGATSNYLQVGGREYGNNGFGGMGFGYVSAPTDHPCVWVGYEEKNTAGNTSGDFLVAVRNATTNTAPVEAFRIAQNKDASFEGNVTVAGTITATGLLGVVASDGKTAQSANINAPTLYAVPTSGMYRVSAYVVLSRAATTSSVLPSCSVTYTEATTGVVAQDIVTLSANTNTLGLHVGGSVVISAQQAANIGYVTSSYASSGATSMQYAIHVKVEFLG